MVGPRVERGAESGRSRHDGHAAVPTAILLHGAGAGPWEWGRWSALWRAEGLEARTPQLPGLDDFAVLRQHLQATLPLKPVLVGASLGGLLALQLAQPVAAAALVLVNPLPPDPWSRSLPQPRPGHVPDWGLRACLAGTCRAVPELDPVDALLAFRGWRDCSPTLLAQARSGQGYAMPSCPILLIASDDDSDVPVALSCALAQALGADLLRVPGSHVAPLLGAEAAALAQHALEWLRQTAGLHAVRPSFSRVSGG